MGVKIEVTYKKSGLLKVASFVRSIADKIEELTRLPQDDELGDGGGATSEPKGDNVIVTLSIPKVKGFGWLYAD